MRSLSLAALAGLLAASPLAAQVNTTDAVEITREQIQTEKKAIVAANMQLTEAESAAFWPIYDQLQGELAGLNRKTGELIADKAPSWGALDADQANKLVHGVLDIDKERADLYKKYWGRFTKVVSPAQTARYYQIERKLRAIMEYELADAIPLIGPAAGS